jgi:DNA polymerase delta subunit 2
MDIASLVESSLEEEMRSPPPATRECVPDYEQHDEPFLLTNDDLKPI